MRSSWTTRSSGSKQRGQQFLKRGQVRGVEGVQRLFSSYRRRRLHLPRPREQVARLLERRQSLQHPVAPVGQEFLLSRLTQLSVRGQNIPAPELSAAAAAAAASAAASRSSRKRCNSNSMLRNTRSTARRRRSSSMSHRLRRLSTSEMMLRFSTKLLKSEAKEEISSFRSLSSSM